MLIGQFLSGLWLNIEPLIFQSGHTAFLLGNVWRNWVTFHFNRCSIGTVPMITIVECSLNWQRVIFHFIFFFWFQKLKSDDSMMTKYYGSSKILLKKLGNWGDQQCDQICQNLADIEQSLSIFSFLGKNFCIYLPLKLPLLWLIFLLLVSGQIWHK